MPPGRYLPDVRLERARKRLRNAFGAHGGNTFASVSAGSECVADTKRSTRASFAAVDLRGDHRKTDLSTAPLASSALSLFQRVHVVAMTLIQVDDVGA